MIIYFFTKEEIVCDSLIQAANFNGHECFVSKDFETIYEKILETQLEPDLFVLDYTLFNPLLFNPFKFLTSKNLFIPLIIYNDPFAPKEVRQFRNYSPFFPLASQRLPAFSRAKRQARRLSELGNCW